MENAQSGVTPVFNTEVHALVLYAASGMSEGSSRRLVSVAPHDHVPSRSITICPEAAGERVEC